ncbi:MAG: hypothetical protein KIT84_20605 [Labilithrix sp.]|nr:hypothetical protein [Labilithrix sp.]MCW5813442.1 hypothetical protein [Labilithrix sp.]
MKPPARTARRIALVLSALAVLVSVGCGVAARHAFAMRGVVESDPEALVGPLLWFLVLLLVALLLRMGAAVCELLWLERTWSNLPLELRKVGPIEKVEPIVLIGVSLVPGVAWIWKLGVIDAVARGFEAIRARVPFTAPVPRRLGVAAVVVGWVPGLNVYVAPFLWEVFATRIDRCVSEIEARRAPA